MKKVLSFFALCLGMCFVSCYDDTAILDRLAALETTTVASINMQLASINASISDLEDVDKELDAAITVIEKEDEERDKRIEMLRDSILGLQDEDNVILTEIEAMCQTLQSLREQDGQLQEEITSIEAAIAALQATDSGMLSEIETMKQTLLQLEEQDKAILAEIASIELSIAELRTEDNAISAEIDTMCQTLQSLREQDGQLQEEITSIEAAIAALQATDSGMLSEIETMKQTLLQLEEQDKAILAEIASIEQSIAELRTEDNAIKTEMGELKSSILGLEERDATFQTDIDSLKAKDVALKARIDELQSYVDEELSAARDWANATFSTLEQYQATCNELAAIKVLIANQEESLMQTLSDAIASSESSIRGWVNEQLTGYWTIAETQAKLDTIKTNTDKEVAAIRSDLQQTREELTSAYKDEISKAIEEEDGKLSARITEINTTLEEKIRNIETRLAVIEEKLNDLTREFAIKFNESEISITDGGAATVGYTIIGATEKTIVKAFGQNGWRARVVPKSNSQGTITVTAPNPLTQDEIIVLVYDGEYRTIMSSLNFVKGFATPSVTAVEFGAAADTVSITLTSNIDCQVSIPAEAQYWLSVVEPTTRATTTETISFACTASPGGIRKAIVWFVDELGAPMASISVIQHGSAMEVSLTQAGTLLDAIGRDVYQEVKGLTINGPINGTDIFCIRRMGNLTYLNMANANIVRGGDCYYETYSTQNDIIGAYMFSGASCFQKGDCEVVLPLSVDTISAYAFSGCAGLVSVELPASLTSIGDYAFRNTKLSSIILPSTLNTIGRYAFNRCTNLASVAFPEILTSIGEYAFSGCTKLSSVNLPEALTTIGNYVFERTSLSEVQIPEGVISIGYGAFQYCSDLSSVTFPSTLQSIGEYAFRGTGITDVLLPESLRVIASSAFSSCDIETLTIPSSVSVIGANAFSGNPITEVFLKVSPLAFHSWGENIFSDNVYNTAILYIPKDTYNGYFTTDFGRFKNIVEELDRIIYYHNITEDSTIVYIDISSPFYSELYRSQRPLERIRFIVLENHAKTYYELGGFPYFALSAFELFDENGIEIELTENDITSNACQNTIGNRIDGGGIAALVDNDPSTYFHSLWSGTPINDYHNLEVTLPEGKYSAFSFAMSARDDGYYYDSRLFPSQLAIVPIYSADEE